MDFSYVHIRYFIGYVYHICLQDTIQSTLSLCLLCQAMLLPMPLRPLLLTTRSGFNASHGCPRTMHADHPNGVLRKRIGSSKRCKLWVPSREETAEFSSRSMEWRRRCMPG